MKPYFLLFAIAFSYCCNATCMLSKISIDERTTTSETIIQGKVIKQESCWNADKTSIYTINTVEVDARLKGSSSTTIEIITPGGEIDGKLLVVEPNAELKVGSEGIFFLQKNKTALKYSSAYTKYEIYAAAQGFIEHDKYTDRYSDPFEEYQNTAKVYSLIQKTTNINYRLGETNEANDIEGDPAITLFTPATISAGTQSVLTISGWGFKERTGAATVQFRNANSTLASSYQSIPDSNYIVSWTNTEIKVIVPGASAFGNGGSGNGIIRVIDKNGLVIESASPLNVTYNQFEYKKNKLILIDKNNTGGYTFTLNNNFNANTEAKASFTRALNQWVCKTGVNATISSTTSTSSCSDQLDNVNTVSFASASCPLPAGALGVTYSSYSLCGNNTPIFPESIDIIFNPNAAYYFGNGTPASNQYDFESVILHELGHAFGQGHNSNGAEVMYPSIANGVVKRVLNSNTDIENVNDVVNRSTVIASCIYPKHRKLTTTCTNEQNVTPVAAQFVTDKIRGCAPLTVKFTDQSSGSPTSWSWDIANNGSIDYTSQNPTHTFTTAGNYTIKLIAYNAATKDSIIKVAHISVAPALNLNIDLIQNVSCYGGTNGSLKAIPTGGDGNYTYIWNNNQTHQQIANMASGTYNVTVKDGFNCTATSTKTITQPEPIVVNINTELMSGNSYRATLNVTGGTAPYTYMLNNATELNGTTVSNLSAGNYSVLVKDKNNCTKNASFSVSSPTPVNETEMQFEALNIYPNPTTSQVNINFSLKDYKNVKVELFDLAGQTIFYDEYNDIRDKQASIDLSSLASGTYLLKFGLPEGSTFRKIIVNR